MFTLVQSAKNAVSAINSNGKAFPGAVTKGNLLIAAVGGGANTPLAIPTISDTLDNVWSARLAAGSIDDNTNVSLWWAIAGTSGADTINISFGAANGSSCLGIEEWTPLAAIQPDQSNFASESRNPGNVITTAAAELIIAAIGAHYTGAYTVNNGFGIDVTQANSGDPGNDGSIAIASLNPAGAPASYTTTFGGYAGSTAGSVIISFFAGVAAPVVIPNSIITVFRNIFLAEVCCRREMCWPIATQKVWYIDRA